MTSYDASNCTFKGNVEGWTYFNVKLCFRPANGECSFHGLYLMYATSERLQVGASSCIKLDGNKRLQWDNIMWIKAD